MCWSCGYRPRQIDWSICSVQSCVEYEITGYAPSANHRLWTRCATSTAYSDMLSWWLQNSLIERFQESAIKHPMQIWCCAQNFWGSFFPGNFPSQHYSGKIRRSVACCSSFLPALSIIYFMINIAWLAFSKERVHHACVIWRLRMKLKKFFHC